MKKKILAILTLCIVTVFSMTGLFACSSGNAGSVDNRDNQIISIYNTYVAYAEENGTTPLSYEEWLKSIKGEKGDTGMQGIQGEKGDKGDTGAQGPQGEKGDKGDTGAQGIKGDKGDKGDAGAQGVKGEKGADGIGIQNTYIDKDGYLWVVLNDKERTEINAGQVVAPIKKLDENNRIVFDEIFAINERTVSTKVSNDTESIYFNDYITILGSAGYSVYKDRDCENLVKSKTVDLEIGDNTFYILEYCGEFDNLYTVNIRRRPIYTVSFNTNGGSEVENQCVEEDGFAFEPVSVLPNNAATWDFDFSNPILEDKEITATWHEVFIFSGTSITGLTDYGKTLSTITAEMFPSGVTAIYNYAFKDCTILENVFISDSIYQIGNYAFKNCINLQNVALLSCNIYYEIGDDAFVGCAKLANVYFKLFIYYNSQSWFDERCNLEFSKAKRYYYKENDPKISGTYWHFDIDGRTILEW